MKNNRILLYLLAPLTILSGCGKKQAEDVVKDKVVKQSLSIPLPTNPTTFDPGKMSDADTHNIILQCFETLVTHAEDNSIVGQLAEKYDIENDGKTYVFTLKKGVKFHNGKEMTAEDVKWSFERTMDPKLASVDAENFLDDIVGAMDKIKGKANRIKGIKIRDKYVVSFDLIKPTPYFLGKLTYPTGVILPKGDVPLSEIADIKDCIGTGPFKMKEYRREQLVRLDAFEDYHGGKAKLDKIWYFIIKDPVTRLNKFKSGHLDILTLEKQDIAGVKADPNLKDKLIFHERPALYFVDLNPLKEEAFKNRDVRRAIAMAINKENIVKNILKGANTVANSLIPPGVPGHRKTTPGPSYDPEKAKVLLEKAGYGPGGKELKFKISLRAARHDLRAVAEAIALDLHKIGVKVKLSQFDWSVFLQKFYAAEHTATHMKWLNDYLDPHNNISIFYHKDSGNNIYKYRNSKVDQLIEAADSITDQQKRVKLYQEAEDIILNDAPRIPIYFMKDPLLVSSEVKGIRMNALWTMAHTTTHKVTSK